MKYCRSVGGAPASVELLTELLNPLQSLRLAAAREALADAAARSELPVAALMAAVRVLTLEQALRLVELLAAHEEPRSVVDRMQARAKVAEELANVSAQPGPQQTREPSVGLTTARDPTCELVVIPKRCREARW